MAEVDWSGFKPVDAAPSQEGVVDWRQFKPAPAQDSSYLGASARSGGHMLAAAGATIVDALNPFTTSEQDAATLYKDDPEGFKRFTEQSASAVLQRFAAAQIEAGKAAMERVNPAEKSWQGKPFNELKAATLDPTEAAYLSPTRIAGEVLQSLPSTLALAVAGYFTKGRAAQAAAQAEQAALAQGASAQAAQAAGAAAARTAGAEALAKSGAAGEGAVGYGQQKASARQDALDVPKETYETSPEYQSLLAQGYAPEVARRMLVAQVAQEAGIGAGVVDAATNALGGEVLGRVIGEGGKLAPRVAKGLAAESATEFVQSGGEQAAQNEAMRRLNPNQDPGQDVLESAVMGAITGGVMGGATAGVFGGRTATREGTPAPVAPSPLSDPLAQTNLSFKQAVDAYLAGPTDAQTAASVLSTGSVDDAIHAAEASVGTLPSVAADKGISLPVPASVGAPAQDSQTGISIPALAGKQAEAVSAAQEQLGLAPAAQGFDARTPEQISAEAQAKRLAAIDRAVGEMGDSLPRFRYGPQQGNKEQAPAPVNRAQTYLDQLASTDTPAAKAFLHLVNTGRVTAADVKALIDRQDAQQAAAVAPPVVPAVPSNAAAPAPTGQLQVVEGSKPRGERAVDGRLLDARQQAAVDEAQQRASGRAGAQIGPQLPAAPGADEVAQRLAAAAQAGDQERMLRALQIRDRGQAVASEMAEDLAPGDKARFRRAVDNVARRGGVASPGEAAILDRMSPNERLYDKIEGRPPALKAALIPAMLPTAEQQAMAAARDDSLARKLGIAPNAPEGATTPLQIAPVPGPRATAAERGIKQSGKRSTQQFLDTVAASRGDGVKFTEVDAGRLADKGKPGELTRSTHHTLRQIARVFGKKLVVFESNDATAPDGFIKNDEPNTIYLNHASEKPHLVVFGHELMHGLKRNNAEAYEAVRKAIKLKDGVDLDKVAGVNGDVEELASDLQGNRFAETDFWADVFRTVAKDSPAGKNAVMRLAATAMRAVNRVMRALGHPEGFEADGMVQNLGEVKAAITEALATYAKQRYADAVAMDRAERAQAPVAQRVSENQDLADKDVGSSTPAGNSETGDSSSAVNDKYKSSAVGDKATRRLEPRVGPPTKAEMAARRARLEMGAVASEKRDVTETPEFKKWFGDSKIVDREGAPLVVYHGTGRSFSAFKKGRSNYRAASSVLGHFFTPDHQVAALYAAETTAKAAGEGQNVLPVFLAIENPKRETEDKIAEIESDWTADEGKAYLAKLKRQGYDGIVFGNGDEIVAFRPEQVKSVFNSGAFDASNPDITKSEKRKEGQLDGIEAYHFSRAPRKVLSSSMYGQGLKGSGRDEYMNAEDGRRAHRIYFYVDKGTGIRPESGVGGVVHKATLDNVYDINKDPLKLKAGSQAKTETNILNAGFDGYLDRMEGTQSGQVIMLGPQSVSVKALPPGTRVTEGKVVPGDDSMAVPQWQDQASMWNRGLLEQKLQQMQANPSWAAYDLRIVEKDGGFMLQSKLKDHEEIVASAKRVTETPEFKKWFGGSKVVDAKGAPEVVFHGTNADFDTFDPSRTGMFGDIGVAGEAAYFTPYKETAVGYANSNIGGGQNVMPVYLKAENPLIWNYDSHDGRAILEKRQEMGASEFRQWVQSRGYDSVKIIGNLDGVEDGVQWAVFEPAQIKSAIGNRGAFDASNPDITKSDKRAVLNVGLSTAEVAGGGEITEDTVRAALQRMGVKVQALQVRDSATEPTAVVTIDRALSPSEGDALSRELQQEAIAQRYSDGTGDLFGPQASNWGPFDPDYFLDPESEAVASKKRDPVGDTSTPEFKTWFGNSQMVNKDSEPMVLYHGTRANNIQVFKRSEDGALGPGIYLTESVDAAGSYAGDGGVVEELYARMEKPLVVYTGADAPAMQIARDDAFWKENFYTRGAARNWAAQQIEDWAGIQDPEFLTMLKDAGYDGVLLKNPEGQIVEAMVPSAYQVKSVLNDGGWSRGNPNIYASAKRVFHDSGRQYTPEQLAAMQRVGGVVEERSLKERLQELTHDWQRKLAQGLVDQFAPIKELGAKGKAAYALARLSKGAAGAVEALLHHGKLSITKDGVYDADQSGGAMERLFAPLGRESGDFLRWIAGNRAERLAAEDRENLFTPADIAAFKSLEQGTIDFDYTLQHGPRAGQTTRDRTLIYRDALKTFNEFNKNALDMAEQSGLIDPESRALWENAFYVPFYREADENGGFIGASLKDGLVKQKAFERLKGGTNRLHSDLLSNALMNWSHLIDAAAKNRAAVAAIDAAQDLGVAYTVPSGSKGSVWVMRDGHAEHYAVEDPLTLKALTSLSYNGLRGWGWDMLTAPKRWLTVAVTSSPAFKIRNLVRDSIQAVSVSELSPNVLANLKQGWEASKHDSQTYVSALAGGGLIRFGTMLEGRHADRVRQMIKTANREGAYLDSESAIRRFYDIKLEPAIAAYNELGNRSEEINRAALYAQLKAKGFSDAEANLAARDLMDFSMMGAWGAVRFLTQVVPFLNARIQGLYKLGRGAKEDPRRFAAVLGAVALASISLMAAYSDDDDWKKREDWDRDNNWWFKFGGLTYRIPKPFEIGAIATLAERGVEFAFNKDMTGERYGKIVRDLLADNLAMNPVPQAVKPIIDLYANTDSFTGRPIENLAMQKLRPEYRFDSRSTMLARGLSTAGNAALDPVGGKFLSPMQIDHLLQGYFGWLGSFVNFVPDLVAREATGQPSRPAADVYKFATQGIVQERESGSSYYVSSLYRQAEAIEKDYNTWRTLLKQGKVEEAQGFFRDHSDKIRRYGSIEKVRSGEAKLNEMIRMIERGNLDPDEKKARIQKLQVQRDNLARVLTQVK